MGSAGLDAADEVALYAAVNYETGDGRLAREVVVGFASPADADRFALDASWSDYQICPLRFLADYPEGAR